MKDTLTLLLNLHHLFHPDEFSAMFVFRAAESFGEEVRAIIDSGDVRRADDFGSDKVPDVMPADVDVFRPVMKDGVFGQGYCTRVVRINEDRAVEWLEDLLVDMSYPRGLLASDAKCIIFRLCS